MVYSTWGLKGIRLYINIIEIRRVRNASETKLQVTNMADNVCAKHNKPFKYCENNTKQTLQKHNDMKLLICYQGQLKP